jgi:hypothetical protein
MPRLALPLLFMSTNFVDKTSYYRPIPWKFGNDLSHVHDEAPIHWPLNVLLPKQTKISQWHLFKIIPNAMSLFINLSYFSQNLPIYGTNPQQNPVLV